MWKAVILATTLFCGTASAFNPEDLRDATILRGGQCIFDEAVLKCFILQKGNDFYIVAFDEEGLSMVFRVDALKDEYEEKEMRRVWKRYRLRDMV